MIPGSHETVEDISRIPVSLSLVFNRFRIEIKNSRDFDQMKMKIQEIMSYAVSDERLKPATHFSKHTQVVIEPNHDLLKFNDQYPLYREVGLDDDCLETDFWRYGDLVSEDACVSYTSTKTTENLECP